MTTHAFPGCPSPLPTPPPECNDCGDYHTSYCSPKGKPTPAPKPAPKPAPRPNYECKDFDKIGYVNKTVTQGGYDYWLYDLNAVNMLHW